MKQKFSLKYEKYRAGISERDSVWSKKTDKCIHSCPLSLEYFHCQKLALSTCLEARVHASLDFPLIPTNPSYQQSEDIATQLSVLSTGEIATDHSRCHASVQRWWVGSILKTTAILQLGGRHHHQITQHWDVFLTDPIETMWKAVRLKE